MTKTFSKTAIACMASLSVLASTSPAAAQPAPAYESAPPPGQSAPPPANTGQSYNGQQQQADRDYAQRYAAWAAQSCVDQRNHNVAAGALVGGVLGAIAGSGVVGRGDHAAGAVVGGALGAGAGAAVAANASATACPPGYVVRADAPPFVYNGPYTGPDVVYVPAWYHPWVWVDGRWVYYPYRYWWWGHRDYWGPRRHWR